MNKRIRELNMQAAEYATSVCPSHSRDWYPIQNTKFAELIVARCCSIADAWVINEDNGKNYPSERIKEHFGLKE